jgi:hypothetical protein
MTIMHCHYQMFNINSNRSHGILVNKTNGITIIEGRIKDREQPIIFEIENINNTKTIKNLRDQNTKSCDYCIYY